MAINSIYGGYGRLPYLNSTKVHPIYFLNKTTLHTFHKIHFLYVDGQVIRGSMNQTIHDISEIKNATEDLEQYARVIYKDYLILFIVLVVRVLYRLFI